MASLLRLPILLLFSAIVATADIASPGKPAPNPFTEKAALLRYWNRKVPNNSPHPSFLLSKLTPLSPADAAKYSKLAAADPFQLSSTLLNFCSAAGLLCLPELAASLSSHPRDTDFSGYQNTNFSNYGPVSAGGLSSFKNYSGVETPFSTFTRYGHESAGHEDKFDTYGLHANVAGTNFTSYGILTAGGVDNFTSYTVNSNVPELGFNHYTTDSAGGATHFSLYSNVANSGEQSFTGYAKLGNGAISDFTSYANNSNVISSGFAHYGENGTLTHEIFSSYGENGNIPQNNFRSYGSNSFAGIDEFHNYRNGSNLGDDSFVNYEKNGNGATAAFINYGINYARGSGSNTFKGYGQGSVNDHVTFSTYLDHNPSFKSYSKTGVDFKSYLNTTTRATKTEQKRWVMEAGKFFRESALKKGTVMPMPDIRDKMLPRSFLPRSIASKIPFSAVSVSKIFKLPADSALSKAVTSTVGDCERPPSRGETKRCVTSAEDMIDFAVSVLGGDVDVRSTATATGSNGDILIGEVKGVKGGKVTESVSCHQSLFPFLLYYCHSVPSVRIYEAEILAVDSKNVINQGVAICHIDTSDWSPNHGAFVALGPGPGKIEVCHWIFQGDMTWTVGDLA